MESYLVGVVAGIVGAAGDLRKLFFRQLMQLLAHGFHFLFQGVQFFFGFHGGISFQILISFPNTQPNENCYSFGKIFSLAFLYTNETEKRLLHFSVFSELFSDFKNPQRKDKKLNIHYKPKPAAFQ